MVAADHVITALQAVVARSVDPQTAVALTVGTIHGGYAPNAIAPQVEMAGTVSGLDEATGDAVVERIRRVATGTAAALGVEAVVSAAPGYPILVNDPAVGSALRASATSTLGSRGPHPSGPAMQSEDFARYAQLVPSAFLWLGAGDPAVCPPVPNRHPAFSVDEAALPLGAVILANGAWRLSGGAASGDDAGHTICGNPPLAPSALPCAGGRSAAGGHEPVAARPNRPGGPRRARRTPPPRICARPRCGSLVGGTHVSPPAHAAPPSPSPAARQALRRRDALVVVLTLATGATDVLAITRLGGVLASVMTANLVFMGLAVAERSASLAGHVAIAIVAFMLGVAGASKVAGQRADNEPHWPPRVTGPLALEVVVAALVAAGWIGAEGRPTGVLHLTLLFAAAGAMGMQSGAVQGLSVAGLSSTYMTGTLTAFLSGLVVHRRLDPRSALTLSALVVGAATGGALMLLAPDLAPLFPLAVLAAVVALATAAGRASAAGA